ALHRLLEAELDLALDVGTATGPARRGAALRTVIVEQVAEQVPETTGSTGAGIAEQVLEPAAAGGGAGPAEAQPAATEEAACLVVLLALGRVAKHGVGLRGLLEAGLGCLVTRVLVRVVVPGDLAERLLDLVLARVLGDAQNLVVVLLDPVLGTHWATSSNVKLL